MKSLVSAAIHVHAGSPASRRPIVRLLALAAAGALAIALMPATAIAAATQPHVASSSDWTQFHNGPTHGGYNTAETILSASSVPHLALAWKGAVNPYESDPTYRIIESSPAIANGVVYIGSRNSGKLFAYAVNCATGGGTCSPLWTASTDNWWISSSPAVYNGEVYVGGAGPNGHLYAFDAAGITNCSGAVPNRTCSPLWTAATGAAITSSPTVYSGVVYVASNDGKLYAFNPTSCGTSGASCAPLWTSAATGSVFHSSPAVAVVNGGYYNGQPLVYVGADDGNVYVYSATGTTGCSGGICSPLWTSTASGATLSSPAVANGLVYVGSGDGRLRAFDVNGWNNCSGIAPNRTCVAIWTLGMGGASIDSSPAVVNGIVYYGMGSNLQAYDDLSSGSWYATTGAHVNSSPAVANGVVYVGSQDDKLYAYDTAGCGNVGGVCSPIWTYTTGGAIRSSPAVANGVVYVGSDDGYLYAFSLPLDHLVLGPANATIRLGGSQTYTAEGFDAYGDDLGDVTAATTFNTSGNGSCTGAVCTPAFAARAYISATDGNAHGSATLHVGGDTYHALTPTRILDSRDGTGGLSGAFSSHVARTFTVTGHGGVPAGATAVTGNLTVTQQTSQGFLSVGPNAQNNPTSSTLNFPVNDDRANAVTVALSGSGTLSITYAAPTSGPTAQVIFDVTGYFTPDTTGATYHALTPTRILDSRDGTGGLGVFSSHVAQTFGVRGHGGVPGNATAVTGNLTVTQQTNLGYLAVGPVAQNNPTSSTLNFPVNDDRANAVTVALSGSGTLSITYAAPTSGPTAQVIFDVTGYFTQDMTGAVFVPLTPSRILDSRDGTGGLSGAFSSHVARTFTVIGHGGVPSGAIAVTGNLTVTQQTSLGYLSVGPVAQNNPTSSTLNFPLNDDRANAVTVALSGTGTLSVTYAAPTSGPTAQVIFDVTGYFAQ
ncbi:MAG TPA: PQQ-binding-like beta-propeller repeat protein [Terriglobales bacterium]|nr:PQQ-binding-like beta-propeller repeat protein [Terriglobales bacterium]